MIRRWRPRLVLGLAYVQHDRAVVAARVVALQQVGEALERIVVQPFEAGIDHGGTGRGEDAAPEPLPGGASDGTLNL